MTSPPLRLFLVQERERVSKSLLPSIFLPLTSNLLAGELAASCSPYPPLYPTLDDDKLKYDLSAHLSAAEPSSIPFFLTALRSRF